VRGICNPRGSCGPNCAAGNHPEKEGPRWTDQTEGRARWLKTPTTTPTGRPISASSTISLVIWALCSFGFGILLRPLLSASPVGGTDLGFWFAQQGSILVFLALIFFYAWRMNKLDREHGVNEE
jgi:putative solute:sodium symporter small subunit